MTNAEDKSRRALGKGLSALLPARRIPAMPADAAPVPGHEPAAAPVERPRIGSTEIDIELIDPNPTQPRTHFHQQRMEELAQSIRANGVIQPLIVRRAGERYELIAGERRWRAARLASLERVPVVVQEFADDQLLQTALIENIQREDLSPIEAAHAFDRLGREMGLSQEEIGRRTGKDRSSIANLIRLLKLPGDVQRLVAEGRLPMGQARALLGLPDAESQLRMAEKAAAQGMSARQVETLVRAANEPRRSKTGEAESQREDPNIKAAAGEMERILGTRVRIVGDGKDRGRIEIDYFSADELQRIYALIVE